MQGPANGFARRLHGLAVLGCLVLVASPAFAGRKDFGPFSVELPAGWRASREGNAVTFLSSDNSCHVWLAASAIEGAEQEAVAREQAQLVSATAFGPAGTGFAFENDGARSWLLLTGDTLVEVSASECPKARKLLAQLKPASKASSGVKAALAAIGQPDVAGWLAYKAAPFALSPFEAAAPVAAAMPDFAALGDAAADGKPPVGITARLPDGWSRAESGVWTVFTAESGDPWLAARTYRLPGGDDFDAYMKFAKDLAKEFNGRNIVSGEGSLSFETPEGYTVATDLYHDIMLLTVFAGDGEGVMNLLSTLVPAEN